ncbi:hypothetical protein SAMN05428950_1011422 [Sphingomonas sp. OV641]|nr:hypothetical protein SAMN05428950_1011422 [Sphingomonas sp. OV641]
MIARLPLHQLFSAPTCGWGRFALYVGLSCAPLLILSLA